MDMFVDWAKRRCGGGRSGNEKPGLRHNLSCQPKVLLSSWPRRCAFCPQTDAS